MYVVLAFSVGEAAMQPSNIGSSQGMKGSKVQGEIRITDLYLSFGLHQTLSTHPPLS